MTVLRTRRRLLLLGAAGELLYLLFFLRRFPLLGYYNGPYRDIAGIGSRSHAAFAGYVGVVLALFILAVLAWREVRDAEDRETLWLVLGAGAVFAVTMVFVYPITAIDIFAYFDQSLLLVQYHANPLTTTPGTFAHDPLMHLSGSWIDSTAPYGPFAIVVDALPTLFVHRNVLANLVMLKLLFSGMAITSAYVVYRILQKVQPRAAISGALLIAWNPLVLFEAGANGHNDIAMMFFLLLGVVVLAEDGLTLAAVLVAVSALVKYVTLLLLPHVLLYGMSRKPTWQERFSFLAVSGAWVIAIVAVGFSRFWAGTDTLAGAQSQNSRYFDSFASVLSLLFPHGTTSDHAALLGRALFVLVYLYTLWLATRGLSGLLEGCFLAMFAAGLLAVTNFLGWYALWAVMLAPAIPFVAERAVAVLFSLGAMLTYSLHSFVWFWLGVQYPLTYTRINVMSYALTFGMATAALAWFLLRRRRQARPLVPQPVQEVPYRDVPNGADTA